MLVSLISFFLSFELSVKAFRCSNFILVADFSFPASLLATRLMQVLQRPNRPAVSRAQGLTYPTLPYPTLP